MAYPGGEAEPGGPREDEYKKLTSFALAALNDMCVSFVVCVLAWPSLTID